MGEGMNILSYGGGVQTVTIAAMACLGDYKMPDGAVFADPQWETKATYNYTEQFEKWMLSRGLTLTKTTKGNLRADSLSDGKRFASLPLYTEPNGMLMRQCTNEYKIQPVVQSVRKMIGLKFRQRAKEKVLIWLGISTNEASRVKPSRIPWIENHYPLIEKGMSRSDCLAYLSRNGIQHPPKSACIGCPFHSDSYWLNLKRNSPDEWEDACQFDDAIRKHKVSIKNKVYLHRSRKPLREVYLQEDQMDFFDNECEGYCGL
jgi:hypothetical protein